MKEKNPKNYWRANLIIIFSLLCIWFLASFGAGILFSDSLDKIKIGGFRLGFWFAQQGSIGIFIILIFFYAWRMNKLDKQYGVDEE